MGNHLAGFSRINIVFFTSCKSMEQVPHEGGIQGAEVDLSTLFWVYNETGQLVGETVTSKLERGEDMVELDNFKYKIGTYKQPLQEVGDSL